MKKRIIFIFIGVVVGGAIGYFIRCSGAMT